MREAEKTSQTRIDSLLSSLNTAPSTLFPAYTIEGNTVTLYPKPTVAVCRYVRLPKQPKWSYITLSGGTPVFDQSASDYQDFELASDEEPNLVLKILQYAGIEIRESDVYAFWKQEEQAKEQKS